VWKQLMRVGKKTAFAMTCQPGRGAERASIPRMATTGYTLSLTLRNWARKSGARYKPHIFATQRSLSCQKTTAPTSRYGTASTLIAAASTAVYCYARPSHEYPGLSAGLEVEAGGR